MESGGLYCGCTRRLVVPYPRCSWRVFDFLGRLAPDGGLAVPQKFDYVVIGAGSAGSVLAARLTETPCCSVLPLEAGGDDNYRWIHIPLGMERLIQDPR